MKSSVDYWWVLVIVIVVILVFSWKPLMRFYSDVSGKMSNKEAYERGREVFYDTDLWGGPESYKSCAMCHAADFVPEADRQIDMRDYRPDQPYELRDLAKKYGGGMLGTGDKLFEQVMRCLTGPDRMQLGRVSMQAPFVQDLLEYLRKQ